MTEAQHPTSAPAAGASAGGHASPPPPPAGPPAAHGPIGAKPIDALSTFVGAVTQPTGVAGPDPRVSVAFALGWQMAELYRPDRRHEQEPAQPDDLPGIASFDETQVTELGLHQIDAALARLKDPIAGAGQDVSLIERAAQALREGCDTPQRAALVLALHIQLLSTLTAADFRLGKAYGLGRALADTCREPPDLEREFRPRRVATLCDWTADLSSAFPPHAGHSVKESLGRWKTRLNADWGSVDRHRELVISQLRRQGELWRSLLSGEKLGRDMLERSNYVRAAESVAVQFRDLALHFIGRFRLLVLAVALLFGGGVALMVSVQNSAAITAGAGGIIASLGLTWKGVGGSLGRAVATIEQPAWEAQLDIAISGRDHRAARSARAGTGDSEPPRTLEAVGRRRSARQSASGEAVTALPRARLLDERRIAQVGVDLLRQRL